MAELQTVAAVFDLLKLTWEAGQFLRRVHNADKTAQDTRDRIKRLESVLEGIQAVLKSRDEVGVSVSNEAQIIERIRESILCCKKPLAELQTKAGRPSSPSTQDAGRSPWDRVKVAWHSPSIYRINGELEARIHTLGVDLSVLQLYEQSRTNVNIESHHGDLLQVLSRLGEQVESGNRLMKQMLQITIHGECVTTPEDADDPAACNEDALISLTECLRAAEDVRERFTEQYSSKHQPDARSERMKRAMGARSENSPYSIATPATTESSLPGQHAEIVVESQRDDPYQAAERVIWTLDVLSMHINAYADRAMLEREAQHFSQAELNLTQAIRFSELREARHNVPFTQRLQMQEELAMLYQKQGKWAEAVRLIHQLLREPLTSACDDAQSGFDITSARQNHLLASVYHDRHICSDGAALNNSTKDIQKAEEYAIEAFNALWEGAKATDRTAEECALYVACLQQLVAILDTGKKPVEAIQMQKLLDVESTCTAESLRRISTGRSRQQADEVVVDKHDILLEAIKSGDTEQVHILLMPNNIDLERACKDRKTFLIHAVEQSNEAVVCKLLDPEVGADINTVDRDGLTALHHAAKKGLYDMIRCLLEHDADPDIRDRRGETAVVKAVQGGHETAVEVFFNKDPTTLGARGGDEYSLLHYAIQSSKPAMIEVLLDLAPELKDAVDRSGKTALHHCAEAEKLSMATALLQHRHRLDVNAKDAIDRTPLHFAAAKVFTAQRMAMVSMLLEYGAKVDIGRPGLRLREYVNTKSTERRDSTMSRTSVSTAGTVGTASTGMSRFSRVIGRFGSR